MSDPDKAQARRRARAAMANLLPERARAEAIAAASALRSLPEYESADVILTFLSMRGEIDTAPFVTAALAAGKPLAVPRIEGDDLVFVHLGPSWVGWPLDRYGIPEPPMTERSYDYEDFGHLRVLVASPGLAFDRRGHRLGRGKGFYDRFLRSVRERAAAGNGSLIVCGYAFEEQLMESVPVGPDDEGIDLIVAGGLVIRF